MTRRIALCLLACTLSVIAVSPQGQQGALLQTWSTVLDASQGASKDTPVTRVVTLLKGMQGTLQKDMDEDDKLMDKLGCWCNNNKYEKNAAIEAATAKIAELKSTIDANTAKSAQLTEDIKTSDAEVAENKATLAQATAQRAKEAKLFHDEELQNMANIESLKNAIRVLGKHHGAAFPQFSLSLISTGSKDIPWEDSHESQSERSFGDFMSKSGLSDSAALTASDLFPAPSAGENSRFLQKDDTPQAEAAVAWSAGDMAVVRKALKNAGAFVQQKHRGETLETYAPASGEILGIMKQLKDEMDASLSESQKAEKDAATTFVELRTAKTAEIENGEATGERKEDELADTNNALAEAKEDLDQTTNALSADTKFMMNLKATCTDADANFAKRKAARLEENKAIAETIDILTSDEARDTMSATFNSFLQTASSSSLDNRRQQAAAVLRAAGTKAGMPDLGLLATTVELDAFGRVKKAIDDMISQLRLQQTEEVKKQDWCKAELQSNDMTTMKANSLKDNLDMKISDLDSTLEKLNDEVTAAKKDIAQLNLELQRATENRKAANVDFQKTIAEQTATQDVLKVALERLAKYYDFAQVHKQAHKVVDGQAPPVAQMSYDKSQGASGVMSMIETLIQDAQRLQKDAQKAEQDEQTQYEEMTQDTFASVQALQKLVTTKMAEKAEADKDTIEAKGDLKDTEAEIEGLGKYNADLHGECDYILKNFDTRQDARQQEIEALQQAKSILSGASSK